MSMADRDGLIWFDGEMVAWREATVHVLTHTLTLWNGLLRGCTRLSCRPGYRHFCELAGSYPDDLMDSCKILGMDNFPIPLNRN